ncbi:NitT/TauT family transport system ATP-binding protein [Herbaspirillum sp. Sphag1AN]|uniref:ABC transporter ATP-binding protein n=1 Tax=unclassified Herbaspirillum TaxID=2624150 RepID=UPI0016197C00|nr:MULTISPECIES: ABC transporter ATP-binding protein [unclassified Herbaspirillum]MBB3211861.1 NitT/TauT family transport system ATP-binding protein [Herbaspirillum sp. Sphag1AN]MBB3244305.1 NitT/TauT family transport system ATP-binding protein [Herbaspirillum sp. Sphag64]
MSQTHPTQELVLEARQLRFAYKSSAPVFEAIDLQVRPREIVCLLGSSGCGKSTLLKVLAGLQTPSGGECRFLGTPVHQPHPRSALVFQQASLLPWLNVTDNIGFGLDFKHQPQLSQVLRRQRIDAALEAVGLLAHAQRFPAQLSGGMAQRVAIARALARQPELLFADEPFSALDAITRAEMQTLLRTLVARWHTAVLLVTHDIDEAILMADRILLMSGQPGHILQSWEVDIAHPRDASPDAFGLLKHRILEALRAQHASHSPMQHLTEKSDVTTIDR